MPNPIQKKTPMKTFVISNWYTKYCNSSIWCPYGNFSNDICYEEDYKYGHGCVECGWKT